MAELNINNAAELNFIVRAGTTFDVSMAFKDAANVPIPLTGKSFGMQVRDNYTGALRITFEPEAQLDQTLRLYVPVIDTEAGIYYYDLIVIEGATHTCYLRGTFQVVKKVTTS